MAALGNISGMNLLVIVLGAFFLVIWLLLYFRGLKYASMFEPLDGKEFRLKEMYGLGYALLELFHYKYKSKKDRTLRQQLEILYGSKYCEYYLRVVHSQQWTFAATVFLLAFALYGLSAEPVIFLIFLVFSWLAYYYFGREPSKKIEQRSEELLQDFCDVVSQLALLTNAGLIVREAWQNVAAKGKGTIYEEMRTAVDEMNNGVAEVDAIYNFGSRCMLPEIKKFTSTLIQGISKGNAELVTMIQEQSKEVWQLKKQLVRRAGEKAASKLLVPILIMFLGILIIILVPIFANIGA